MRSVLCTALLASALGAVACSAAHPPPAKPPATDAETRLDPPHRSGREHDEVPTIHAPPPAYGNKIVMAERRHSPKL